MRTHQLFSKVMMLILAGTFVVWTAHRLRAQSVMGNDPAPALASVFLPPDSAAVKRIQPKESNAPPRYQERLSSEQGSSEDFSATKVLLKVLVMFVVFVWPMAVLWRKFTYVIAGSDHRRINMKDL